MKILTFANEVSIDFQSYIVKAKIQKCIPPAKFNDVSLDLLFQNFSFSSFKVIS